MNNKYAIVTGASSGIGKFLSIELAKENFNVIMISRNKKKLQQVSNEINLLNCNCSIIVADISKEKDISKISSQIKSLNIDVLINNAGVGIFNKIQDISFKEWNHHIDINLTGTFMMTKIVVDNMIKNKSGKIIGISSVVATSGNPGQSNYVAAKSGMIGFYKSIALEVASRKINVNLISPGFIISPMTSKLDEKQKNQILDKIPMKRFGERHELENLASYLMSDGSAYINGEVVTIDGGEWIAGAAEFSELTKLPESMWKAMAERRKKK